MGFHQGGHPVEPGPQLEKSLAVIQEMFQEMGIPWWLSFGGLWAIIANGGIIPDGDLDFCTHYGMDHDRIVKIAGNHGYHAGEVMVSDTDRRALYMHLTGHGLVEMCLSFWVPIETRFGKLYWYCHNQNRDLANGVPQSGYFFKGMPEAAVDGPYRMAEWPGIRQNIRVRVPRLPGLWLDSLYPDWAYKRQRYNIDNYAVQPDKMASYHHGGAKSKYRVHVQSMAEWAQETKKIEARIEQGIVEYYDHLKKTEK